MQSIKEEHEYTPTEGDNVDGHRREGENPLDPKCSCGGMLTSEMLMTVAIDSEKPRSIDDSDNNIIRHHDGSKKNSLSSKKKSPSWLESSFVHLVSPQSSTRRTKDCKEHLHHPSSKTHHNHQHGFLARHQHLLQLLEAAYMYCDGADCNNVRTTNNNDKAEFGMVELCADCIDRVVSALEVDTRRLYDETQVYQEAIRSSRHRIKSLRKTTNRHVTSEGAAADAKVHNRISAGNERNNNNSIELAYEQEIAMLEQEIQARSDELSNFKSLHKEQTGITLELGLVEEALDIEQNSLELQSQAFDYRRQILTRTLTDVQEEVDKLTVISLPRVLFDLQVDQARGLHYPLINQLRLAFRPKGDVPAQEIQVAWSQATQLLLVLGTLLEYPGLDWKLVPLADCAKLIYRKEIFNLVPGDCRSLMAWNALLDRIVKHTLSLVANEGDKTFASSFTTSSSKQHRQESNSTSNPPYLSSPTMIGNTELARLDPIDHVGWSQVIHRMASNLLWLSNRASSLAATQVSSMVHCVV